MVRSIVKKLHERVTQGEVKLGENKMYGTQMRMGLYGYDMPGEAPAKPGVGCSVAKQPSSIFSKKKEVWNLGSTK